VAVAVAGRAEDVHLGGRDVVAELDEGAAGAVRADVTAPAAGVRDLAADDTVRVVTIGRTG
jgi:hypothetical protein